MNVASYSCVEGEEPWPGAGNINADPLFCGWDSSDVAVGSQEDLDRALRADGFDLALSPDSPCLGTGEGGANMGAGNGTCNRQPQRTRLVRLARGTYAIPAGASLVHRVSLEGAGQEESVLEGAVSGLHTVSGLRTGASLSGVTVTGSGEGILVSGPESPEIRECAISGNSGVGVSCQSGASPILSDCEIVGNSGSGVYCYDGAEPTLRNCVIRGNRSYSGGGVGRRFRPRPSLR